MFKIVTAFVLLFGPLLAGEPSRVALSVLEELKGQANLKPTMAQMAISRFCGPEKRKSIEFHWTQRQRWISRDGVQLRIEEEQVDGNLAGVLVSVTHPENPESLEILSLGMVKEGDEWKMAPVEGGFENVGLAFTGEVRQRRQELEKWLATKRVSVWSQVKNAEEAEFRRRMLGEVDQKIFRTDDSKVAMKRFLEAVKAGRLAEVFVWLGVLEKEEFPDREWDRELRAIRTGLAGNDQQKVWRLLTSNQVMRRIVDEEISEPDAEYVVGFVHTFQVERFGGNVTGARFALTRTQEGWRITLPAMFAFADEDGDTFQNEIREGSYWQDRNTAQRIGTIFEKETKPLRMGEPDLLLNAALEDMKVGDLDLFLRKFFRESDPKKGDNEGEEEEDDGGMVGGQIDGRRTGRYQEMVKSWSTMLGADQTAEGISQTIMQDETLALAIVTTGQREQGWKPVYHQIWMKKEAEEWMFVPGNRLPMFNSIAKNEVEIANRLVKKFEDGLEALNAKTLDDFLGQIGVDQKDGSSLAENEARELVVRWRELARGVALKELLANSAVMEKPKNPTELFRNVNFVRQGAQVSEQEDQILGTKTSGRFVGVSMQVDQGAGNEAAFPLVFVIPTQNGHGVLIDIELPFETNKGVRLLNEERLERLSKVLGEDDFAALNELRKWHQEMAKPAFEKWQNEKAEALK